MDQAFPADIEFEPEVRSPRPREAAAFLVGPRGASLGDQQAEMGWAGYLRASPRSVVPPARSSPALRIHLHVTCPYCRSQAYEITFAWTDTGRLVRGRCGLCGAHGEWHHRKAAWG
jgi:hypothetical protein